MTETLGVCLVTPEWDRYCDLSVAATFRSPVTTPFVTALIVGAERPIGTRDTDGAGSRRPQRRVLKEPEIAKAATQKKTAVTAAPLRWIGR